MKLSTNALYYAIVISVFILFLPHKAWAQDYVLPYPGFMPGHPLYSVSQVVDQLQEWWSIGSLAKFGYHLGQADKKLIEAKILFEYKQYLLGRNALLAYERHLKEAFTQLGNANLEGKNISQKATLFNAAIRKHRGLLEDVKSKTPAIFVWKPEKVQEETIEIEKLILEAIELGKACTIT